MDFICVLRHKKLIKSESHIEVNLISKCKILTTEMFSQYQKMFICQTNQNGKEH